MTTCPHCGRTPTPAYDAAIADALEFDTHSWWAMHDRSELGSEHTQHTVRAVLPLDDLDPADYGISSVTTAHHREPPAATAIPMCQIILYVISGLAPADAFTDMDGHSAELGHLATAFVLGTAPIRTGNDEPLTVAAIPTLTMCACWHDTDLPANILLRTIDAVAPRADLKLANSADLGIDTFMMYVGQSIPGPLGHRGYIHAGHGIVAAAPTTPTQG